MWRSETLRHPPRQDPPVGLGVVHATVGSGSILSLAFRRCMRRRRTSSQEPKPWPARPVPAQMILPGQRRLDLNGKEPLPLQGGQRLVFP